MKKPYQICWMMAVIMSQACHNAEKTALKRFDKNPGFYTEIPRGKNGEPDYMYRYAIKEDSKFLGLDSLEHGYDSVQFRVWLGHSLAIKDEQVHPKSGWADFVKTLTGFNIYNLQPRYRTRLPRSNNRLAVRRISRKRIQFHLYQIIISSCPPAS